MEISEKWIQQEKAMVQKRLERFRQAVNSIRQKNQALLKNLGFASFKELEKMLMEKDIHPDGLEMFKKAMAEKKKELPVFLSGIPAGKKNRLESPDSGPGTNLPPLKKKRITFRL